MYCVYCDEPADGTVVIHDDKIYHEVCLEEFEADEREDKYVFVDEYVHMEEMQPYLEDTLRSDKWVIVRSNSEHGIYDVISVDELPDAVHIAENPNYDRMGYDRIDAVYHDGREMTITVTLS